MELKRYLNLFIKEKKFIFTFTFIATLSAFICSYWQQPYYENYISCFVFKKNTQPMTEFQYDGYYALQANTLISESIGQLLNTPQIVNSIYKNAEIDHKFTQIKHYKRHFKITKATNQYIEISYKTSNQEDAEILARATETVIQNHLNQIAQQSAEEINFTANLTNPITIFHPVNIIQNLILATICGLIFSIFTVLIKQYFT